jgi:hypothetical protein
MIEGVGIFVRVGIKVFVDVFVAAATRVDWTVDP